jgi:hypothetical protein
MPLRRSFFVLFSIALFSLASSESVWGAELYGWIANHYYGPTPYYLCNPKTVAVIPPIPPKPGAVPTKAVIVNPSLSGGACPSAYPYGYFGTQYRPYSVTHQNYYNDYIQWSFRRGY